MKKEYNEILIPLLLVISAPESIVFRMSFHVWLYAIHF
jgi:hypothetical protein